MSNPTTPPPTTSSRPKGATVSRAALNAYRKKTQKCRIQGCTRTVRGLSNFCHSHDNRQRRYGSPTGRAVSYVERKPYIDAVTKFVNRNREHPALQMVFADIEKLLADAANYPVPAVLKVTDWRPRLYRELARLHHGSVPAVDVFKAVASIYLLAHREPRRLEYGSREMKFAITRAVIFLRDRDGSRRGRDSVSHTPISTLVSENLGRDLLIRLLPVLRSMTDLMDRQGVTERQRREEINKTIEETPFSAEYERLAAQKAKRDRVSAA